MDDNKIREMSEVEGMLTRYIQRYVTPEVVSRYRYVSDQHAKEHPMSSAPIIGSVYGSAGTQSRDMSQWKPADTAGILDYVADKVGQDKAMSLDMVNLTEAWKAAYIKNYGKERYEEISRNVEFGDLATYYVNTRMRHLMLERLAQEKVPKSSLEFVAVSAAQSSIVGTVLTALTDKEKQKEFEMVRRLYNPSAGEKVAAEASAFALDCLSLGPLGGMGGGAGFTGKLAAKANYKIVSSRLANRFGTEFAEKMLAKGVRTEQWLLKNTAKTEFVGFELFDRGGEIIRDSGGGDSKELSRLLYGDEGTCDKIRSAEEGKALDSDICDAVNACLNRKVITEFRDGNASRYSKVITDRAGGDGAAMLDGVREIINYNGLAHLPNRKVPDWMMKKCSEDVCIKNAGYYLGIALEMQSKGKTSIKIGSKQMTLQQVTQQAYDYARAADRKAQDRPRTPKDALEERISENEAYLNAVGLIPDDLMDDAAERVQDKPHIQDSHILQQITSALHKHGMAYLPESRWPSWMDRMDEETLVTNAKRFRNIAIQMQSARKDTVSVNGQQMTLQEVSQRAYDYARASDAKYKEAQAKSRLEEEEERRWNENMAAIEEGNRMPEPKATEAKDDTRTRYAVQITTGDQQGEAQDGQQRGRMTKGNSAPWKGWLDTLGLGGLSDLTGNLGETIAMLPEMLVGMFTGKIKGFSMKDNMMPLALIFGGLLFGKRNPLLRLLLMGFGGMLLLNNANKVLTGKGEGQQQQPRATYRRIEDEPLNPRIRNVELKGNTILAEVDGLQTIFTIESERTIDAYNKGVLPLNVMCNAALRKFDESKLTASEHYEHIARNQEQRQEEEEQIRIR